MLSISETNSSENKCSTLLSQVQRLSGHLTIVVRYIFDGADFPLKVLSRGLSFDDRENFLDFEVPQILP
jgi:hypothetical protein